MGAPTMNTIAEAAIRQNGLRPPVPQVAPVAKPTTATAPGAAPAARPAGARNGTILTNPAGLTNETVQRKTLLTA